MGETRVDLVHLLQDLRDAYPGSIEETIVTEMVANALDSGADVIEISTDSTAPALTVVDNGSGMRRVDLRRYHDIAATTKTRGRGIGFAGVGIKLGLLVTDEVFTETRRDDKHIATTWRLSSKRRAPWSWVAPADLVEDHGTAVRLHVQNALSPLVDAGYLEAVLYAHFEPLFDPAFTEILSRHYPNGVRFLLNGQQLAAHRWDAEDSAPVAIKLHRKRKPSAAGFLVREEEPLPEDRQGIAISTFGKVIKRGWDWLGITPAEPDLVGGLIEAPALAQSLTLNKADFIRVGASGAPYLAYRKAIQEAVANQLSAWGLARDRPQRDRRRAARPMERDLERVLIDLADAFPLLSTLMERQAGGQRRLPIGIADDSARAKLDVSGPEPAPEQQSATEQSESPHPEHAEEREPTPPPTSMLEPAVKGPRRPTRYRLNIRFESRADTNELSRLVQSTVWINEAHPAYRRAVTSRSTGYHIALSTATALGTLAVDPVEEHDFLMTFLARWGEEAEKASRGKRKDGKTVRR